MRKRAFFLLIALLLSTLLRANTAYASIAGGLTKTLFSAFEIPKAMLQQGSNSFPFGLVTGALTGTYRAVTGTVSGVGELVGGTASGAVSAAKTAAPYAAKYGWIALL